MDLDHAHATYEVNVFGPMSMTQAFAPLPIEARGLILNISITSSVVPYLFGANCSSTKGAINTYSRALRLELKPFNVHSGGTRKEGLRSEYELGINRWYRSEGFLFVVV